MLILRRGGGIIIVIIIIMNLRLIIIINYIKIYLSTYHNIQLLLFIVVTYSRKNH